MVAIVLSLVILLVYLWLYIISKRYSKSKNPFVNMASYLYQTYPKKLLKRQMEEELERLEPTQKSEEVARNYGIEKLKIALLMLFSITLLALCMGIQKEVNFMVEDGERIARNAYGEGKKEITLYANLEKQRLEIPLQIEEKQYTKTELEDLYNEYLVRLEKEILLENSDVEDIRKDMKFPVQIEGFPFSNEWECSDYTLLESNGKLGTRIATKGGEVVTVSVISSYYDWKKEYCFAVRVLQPELSWEEELKNELARVIVERQGESKEEDYVTLPQEVMKQRIVWKEKKEQGGLMLLVLGFLSAFLVYEMKDHEIHKKILKRQEEMLLDYPEIVSKISLLMGAGLSLRQTIEKIANEYLQKKQAKEPRRYAYEEIVLTYYEMERGVSEIKAYENLGKRSRVQVFMKLGTLLAQNSKKGNRGLWKLLEKEATEAFVERKNQARKKGEEAGTKLLLPMMIMLSIVMVIIIVPAFLSFQI